MKLTIYTDEKTQQEALNKIKSVMPDAYIIFDAGEKPKTADEMFEELGYKKKTDMMYRKNFNDIITLKSKTLICKMESTISVENDEILAIAKSIEERK